jgi:LacI family transcriptional regulator
MEPQKRITSQDVAKRAGVSRTTVSLVLNNKHQSSQISDKTVQKVLRSAHELGYVPNAAAQALVRKKSGVIGLVLTRAHQQINSDLYLNQVVNGLMDVCHDTNFRVLLDVIEDEDEILTIQRIIQGRQVDGIIFFGPRNNDKTLSLLSKTNFPTVLMGALPDSNFYSVDVDNLAAAQMATEHLIQLGHQRIGCITNATPSYTAAADRLQGYKMALSKHKLLADDRLVRFGDFDPQSGYRAMRGLLSVNPRPTGVFVASDVVAFGAISAITEAGLRIPEDIAVVGFDDVPLSAYITPHLTSVHLPIYDLAVEAGLMTIQLINGESPEKQNLRLNTHLVVRDSCGSNRNN